VSKTGSKSDYLHVIGHLCSQYSVAVIARRRHVGFYNTFDRGNYHLPRYLLNVHRHY